MSKKDRATNRAERAAAVQAEQASRERNRRLLIVVAVLVVLGAVVAAGVIFSGGGSTPAASGTEPKAGASGEALVVGTDPNAMKVVIYEDFLCPYCREFETATRDFLHADADKGKVLVEYRPFHLLQDDYSTLALTAWAAVLKDGTPGQALKFHDLLFENQPYENAASKPGIGDLVDLAKKAGVTDSKVLDAMRQPDQAFVDAADSAANKAGVKGTPTVFVDGKELGGASIADMADQLKQLIATG
ncbi:MAG: oxidoreductase [Marmoricola sp.]|nr:oxidoreductase [Marmoricola sp.]